jgi:hypothetical protein
MYLQEVRVELSYKHLNLDIELGKVQFHEVCREREILRRPHVRVQEINVIDMTRPAEGELSVLEEGWNGGCSIWS